jgi:hypothetical protein
MSQALRDAAPDRYRLTESGDHDVLVREMVQTTSQRLYSILADYPRSVADAKRRADDLRFPMSCEDHVGRLLAVLADAVPAGGRVS